MTGTAGCLVGRRLGWGGWFWPGCAPSLIENGTVGATGRATGPHLDIRLNWFDVRLDPATVLNLN